MNKKTLLFRFDFKRKKNLSYGHFFRAKKILSILGNQYNIFYLIKTPLEKKQYKYLINKNLTQSGKYLLINKKVIKKKFDFLIIDLPYKDSELNLIKSQINKIIVLEDHFSNYDLANFYFTNRKLNKYELKKVNISNNNIFHGNRFFINEKKIIKNKPPKILKNFFINFGGSDPLNLTNKLLSFINHINFSKYNFHVVLGPGAKEINKKKIINKNIKIYYNLSNKRFDFIRKNCDIAIVSGGNILIENIFLGLPSMAFASSNYENFIINQLIKINVTIKLHYINSNKLLQAIQSFDYNQRTKIYNSTKIMIKNNMFEKKFKSILDL